MLNVKKLLTKLLEKTIVENSTNNYITIGNFAMCWGYKDIPNIAASGYTYIEPTFPITFSSEPLVVPYVAGGFGSGRVMQLIASHGIQSTTKAKILLYNYAGGAITTASNGLGYVAIGFIGGGYFLKVFSIFSRLAERRWEYAEHKEDSHEYNGERTSSANRFASRDAFGKFAIVCGRTYEHTERSNSQGGKFSKDAKSELGVQCNRFVRCGKSKGFVLQYGRGSGKWNIRRSGILHDIALISERGWAVC